MTTTWGASLIGRTSDRVFHVAHERADELLRAVMSRGLEDVIARRNLEDHRHVAAGPNRDSQHGNRNAKDVQRGFVEAEAIERLVVAPRADLDHELQRLFGTDGVGPEQITNVDDADA